MFLFGYAGLGRFGRFGAFGFSGALVAQNCSKSPRARSGPLRAARNRSERAQSRSEPRRIAQSGRSELLKAPLQIAQSAPRATQSPSDSPRAVAQSRSEPPRAARETDSIGELGVTCTLHIRCAVLLDVVLSSPCMYMHRFTLVYIYI